MLIRILKLLVIYLCGYLIIKWISIPHPFVLSDFFIGLVMNPLEFFAVSLVYISGILITGGVIRKHIHRTRNSWKKSRKWGVLIFLEYSGLVFIFLLLFQLGMEHTLIFFSFSILYGMISLKL
jgi:hypothetical protein